MGIAKATSNWALVAGSALALTVSTGSVIGFSFAVFMKPLTVGLKTDRGTLSLAPALALLLFGLFAPIIGVLTDRYGLRRIVPTSIVLTAAGLALLGAATHSVPTFIAFYCLTGLVGAGYSPLPFAKAVSAKFQTHRGLALGLTMAGVGIGTALVPVLVQAIITAYGWRLAYVCLSLIVLLVALPATLMTLPDLRFNRTAAPEILRAGLTSAVALRGRVFWKLAGAFALVALATTGVMNHIAALLSDRGISPGYASTALSVGGVALIFGRLLSGYLLDKLFAPWVALAFFCSALFGIILLISSSIQGMAWVATGMVGLSLGAEVDLIAYLLCRYLGQRAFGAIYGWLFAAFTLGTSLGPLSMGQTFARTGSYRGVLIAFIGGLLIACVLITRLGPYRYRPDGTAV